MLYPSYNSEQTRNSFLHLNRYLKPCLKRSLLSWEHLQRVMLQLLLPMSFLRLMAFCSSIALVLKEEAKKLPRESLNSSLMFILYPLNMASKTNLSQCLFLIKQVDIYYSACSPWIDLCPHWIHIWRWHV